MVPETCWVKRVSLDDTKTNWGDFKHFILGLPQSCSLSFGLGKTFLWRSWDSRLLAHSQTRNTCGWGLRAASPPHLLPHACVCVGRWRETLLTHWTLLTLCWPVLLCLLLQVDVTKCVVNSDTSFCSHWLVCAVCAFGHYVKATVLYLLREKWGHGSAPHPVYTGLHWTCLDEHVSSLETDWELPLLLSCFFIYCQSSDPDSRVSWRSEVTHGVQRKIQQ